MGRFGPPKKVSSVPRKPLQAQNGPAEEAGKIGAPATGAPSAAAATAQQCKVDAARAVGYRESLLMQVNAVVVHWPDGSNRKEAQRTAEAVRLLTNLSKELREASLSCVEKVMRCASASIFL